MELLWGPCVHDEPRSRWRISFLEWTLRLDLTSRLFLAGEPRSPSRSGSSDAEVNAAEVEWVARAQRGDRNAFSALVDLYRERILRLALHMVGNSEDAHDLCQETFIRVYQALNTFDQRRAFSPWLYRIAHNVILDFLRRKKARPVLSEPDMERPFEEGPDPAVESPQKSLLTKETYQEVRQAIQSLPENYRSVVVLRYLEDLSYPEIAESLEITEENVMMRMSRARRMLRDKLKHLQTEG